MAYTQEQMLLQWSGSWRIGAQPTGFALEEFSGTMRFAGPGLDQADSDFNGAALAIVLAKYWNELSVQIPGNCFLESVKWNRLDVEGKYKAQTTRQITFPPANGSGATQYPTQVAWATTWGTDVQRGLAARGRTYWPTSRTFDGNTMKVTPANCLAKAERDLRLMQDLTAAARSGFVELPPQSVPLWASALGWDASATREGSGVTASIMSNIGAGVTRAITTVGVGDRLDIQRRRAGSMPDVRQSVSVTGIPQTP